MKDDMLVLLDKIRYEATAIQTQVTELKRLVAESALPSGPRPACPTCGTSFRNRFQVAEHLYNAHDGPVPAHYVVAEARAWGEDDDA